MVGPGLAPGYLAAGRRAALVAAGRPIGWFGEVTPAAREAFDLAAPVFVAELSLTRAARRCRRRRRCTGRCRASPAVQRDLAIVVPADVTAAQIEAAIRSLELPLLVRVALFDVYTGAQVGPGQKSLAFGLTWQAPDRTLTDREVNELHARVVGEIADALSGRRARAVKGESMAENLSERLRSAGEVHQARGGDHRAPQGRARRAGRRGSPRSKLIGPSSPRCARSARTCSRRSTAS